MARLAELSEAEILRRLAAELPPPPDGVRGIGDDCAVVPAPDPGCELVLKSDPVVEGVHFLPGERGERVGHKALARVLSDFAAAGAAPRWALVNVQAAPGLDSEWLCAAYRGLGALARQRGVAVVGGDIGRADRGALHVFAAGQVPAGTVPGRGGARPGDRLFVTGALGGSLAGRHLDFEPRLAEGAWLRERGGVTAMMDLSDGLARDLAVLCAASGTGAVVDPARLPLTDAARRSADPAGAALGDGEDYELLFTVPADRAEALRAAWPAAFPPITAIGEMRHAAEGLALLAPDGTRRPWPVRAGYEAFRADGGPRP